MKKILGLDLGTTSVGWAFIKESDDPAIKSSIEKIGVRIIQYDTFSKVDKSGKVSESKNPESDFSSGKGLSPNADRTLKRGARRNLQRYKQRRSNLIDALLRVNLITTNTILTENEKQSTHATYQLRSKAANESVSKEEFVRVLLMINKKRGYKSSRKAKNEEEGVAIDGMTIAKRLYEENLTPGQLSYGLLKEGKKSLPDYYRSDLQNELSKVWNFQKQFHSEILTDELRKEIEGKGQKATAAIFWSKYKFNTADIKGSREEKKLKAYEWRSIATTIKLSKEEAAYVITEINGNIKNSSGYLGAISDRSKELYFNNQTIGQYLYAQLKINPHTRLKNQVFYRQDYFDEFEKIWETQAKFHKELTHKLKEEIRDIIIFYQRKLKSQKSLVSFCEFESRNEEIEIDCKKKIIVKGYKVAPKSSPLFQEFKIWQNLNSLIIQNKSSKEERYLEQEEKEALFEELNIKGNLSKEIILDTLGYKSKDYELNFPVIEGNRTNQALYKAYLKMMELEDDEADLLKFRASDLKENVSAFFEKIGINKGVLDFNAELDDMAFEKQPSYQLWHLLYSTEDDIKKYSDEEVFIYGKDNIGLKKKLCEKFGFKPEHAKILSNVSFQNDYGNLSAKAIRKIFPYIKELKYSKACAAAGYNHSSSLTKEENENRILKEKLELLPKNSLRNPVVEKILNQTVNVVNAIIADPLLGKPDEIRIELARELKKNANERAEMTLTINANKIENDKIKEIIKRDFPNVQNPTKNDVIRYKLYHETKNLGYKNIYTNEKIDYWKLYDKDYDIDHIIPQSKLFDDSFSNKVLIPRQINLNKGNRTAYDYISETFGVKGIEAFNSRIEMLFNLGKKNKEEGINKVKYLKLLKKESEIGQGFIERDLRDSQYIAKKAKEMLQEICKTIVSTSGSITDRLREDWGLINIMQELNFDKYQKLGLTEPIKKKDGSTKERIIDWTKRNDHRHHAMDALTVAFTKHSYIQYLNNLNAKSDKKGSIYAIEQKETEVIIDSDGNRKRKFKPPIPNFRQVAKEHLENILVSYKAKNKVVTKNKNKFKTKNGEKVKIELTPRGQLHKETVYGKLKRYNIREEKIGAKFDEATILKVAKQKERELLLKRLSENNNDSKKAFTGKNSLDKNPIYLDEDKKQILSDKVKLVSFEDDYTIRKDITPENFKDEKNIDKVIDAGVKKILLDRLNDYQGNAKEAFSNLDKKPIWLNKEKGIAIKRVTISGVKNAEALHFKKDHLGKEILDETGKRMGVDFVSTGNNHHVAIYRDPEGKLQEKVVSFYEAVAKVNQGLPVIDKQFNQDLRWQFLFTMKQNEYFVFPNEKTGFDPNEINLLDSKNYKLISPNLFRVQKIATKNYFFRHHLETTVEEKKELKDIAYKSQLGLNAISGIVKVRINHIGEIVKVGEY